MMDDLTLHNELGNDLSTKITKKKHQKGYCVRNESSADSNNMSYTLGLINITLLGLH